MIHKFLTVSIAILISFYAVCTEAFGQESDSIAIELQAAASQTDSKYIDPRTFIYADTKRFTITGDLPLKNTDIKPITTAIIAGVYVGVFILQHEGQMNTIWQEQSKEFRIIEDGRYALWADKAGHFFGCYLSSYVWQETLMLAGFSHESSAIWGSVLGLSYEAYVEILDGYGANWGFSPSDFYADLAGSIFYLGQHYFPVLQNFTPKFMYVPPEWHGDLDRKPHDMFIDNYSAHTIWLSVNVENLLPETMKDYWPDWLELSFGYAARNLCSPDYLPDEPCDPSKSEPTYTDVWGNPKFIVALDYNLVKILPEGGSFWNWFRQSLNYFKLPSPAVEFGAYDTKFYLMYPFKINL